MTGTKYQGRPDEYLTDAQKSSLKSMMLSQLDRQERLVVILHYHEKMDFGQIGETLDLSERAVSEMHSGILRKLKSHLTDSLDSS